MKGYKLKIVTSDAFSEEKINTMKAFGAELTIVPSVGGKTTPDLIPKMMEVAEEIGKEASRHTNKSVLQQAYAEGLQWVGDEILDQLDGKVDAFVASFGTGGCSMGVAEVLKA